ncbi:MAG: cellulase family glycosylhydrolase [Ruminococcaceae bacterium]|nr:cellulase family glycosylhydrolase [Oscillospiraceae bacterium]
MKKIFVKAIAFFAALTLTLTGCNIENSVSDAETADGSAQGGLSAALGESGNAENTAEESTEEKNDTEVSENTDNETKAATEAVKTTESVKITEAEKTTAAETAGTEETANISESAEETSKAQTAASTSSAAQTVTSSAAEAPTDPRTGAQTCAETSEIPQAQPIGTLTASCNIPGTWQENGSYCGTCEFTIANDGGTDIENWTVKINVPDGFKVTASWNGKFELGGKVLTVTNESYNGSVASGGSAGFGFNFSSPVEFKAPDDVTVNGNTVKTESGGGNTGAGGQSADTTVSETAALLPAPAVAGLVKEHGKLSVKGTQLVDKNGDNFQLKGMSTHGLSWFPDFVNENAFKTLRDDWNTNVVRLAMYTAEYGGYCSGGSRSDLKALIDKGVQAATDLGMYVIIDWHILSDGNPQTNKSEALSFFEEMSLKYKNYDNVLYEICNEPNGGVSWDNDIKPYAEEVIAVIRKNAPDSVIIVGTPTWSQDIDKAAANPLKEKNVLYALHFYAATHTDWLRQRLTDCYNKGLPVFVSEFGTCDASGNGANDFSQAKQWLDLLDKYGISYINWNLANKNETSSAFKESASAGGNWSAGDLSEGGAWIRKWFRGEG